jgi:acetyl/propionyl-CoA carboxylase alpha subunit
VSAGESGAGSNGDPFEAGPWRLLGATRLRYRGVDGKEHAVEICRAYGHDGQGRAFRLLLDSEESVVEVLSVGGGEIRATVDGLLLQGGFAADGWSIEVFVEGAAHALERPGPPDVEGAAETGDRASLTAPMPGTVVKVLVDEGDEVEEGQTLLVLEAMKMEQSVAAPYAGKVRALPFDEGARVPGGAVLAELEEGKGEER